MSNHPTFRGLRRFLSRRFITFVTFSKVEFVDVLTADALTSMSKLLADMQVRVACSFGALQGPCLGHVASAVLAFAS